MLVEMAVGDAYGACFEYADAEFVAANNSVRGYLRHPRHLDLRPGHYTDDTQMSLAITEVLVSGEPWTAPNLAAAFVRVFRRDERPGYARGFQELLRGIHSGAELLARIQPDSDKSGAAMRAGPLGVLPTLDTVLHYADVQARITHNTPDGVEAAQAAALAVHYCYHRLGPRREIGGWIERQLRAAGGRGNWSQPWEGTVGAKGWMSVRAALTALTSCDSLSDLVRTCVAYTGDVDTVATIACAAASCSADMTHDLPLVLLDNLENGPYGRDYLRDLDTRLTSRYPPT